MSLLADEQTLQQLPHRYRQGVASHGVQHLTGDCSCACYEALVGTLAREHEGLDAEVAGLQAERDLYILDPA